MPFLLFRGDGGLYELEANAADLDKYTHTDGTPKEPEWWTKLPGGAAANVIRNWKNGYSNDWGELGWAALDVADGALLVASLGSSSALTVAKQGAKAGGRLTTAELRSASIKAVKVGPKQGRVGSVARIATDKVPPLLRRTLAASGAALRPLGYTVRIGGRALSVAGQRAVQAAVRLKNSWTAVPAAIRTTTYRALLAVG